MKFSKNLKKLLPFVIFAVTTMSFSSCNRGMGCPTFSIGDTIEVLSTQHTLTQQFPTQLLLE